MRICISAGHGLRDPGALNDSLKLREHVEAYGIVWELRDTLKAAGHQVEFISCFQTLGNKIANVNQLHLNKRFDWAIEVHFNSARSNQANGTEVLFLSEKNKAAARKMSAAIASALGTRDRGAKKRTNLGWLKKTKPPALIVEVLFLNNANEAKKINHRKFGQKTSEAILAGLK